MGVTDIVANHWFFATYFTHPGHGNTPRLYSTLVIDLKKSEFVHEYQAGVKDFLFSLILFCYRGLTFCDIGQRFLMIANVRVIGEN